MYSAQKVLHGAQAPLHLVFALDAALKLLPRRVEVELAVLLQLQSLRAQQIGPRERTTEYGSRILDHRTNLGELERLQDDALLLVVVPDLDVAREREVL